MNKLPSDWQIKTLNEVCFPSSSNIAYKDVKDKKGNYPIFGASGIVAYADFYSKEKECLGIVKDGSVGKIFLLPAKSSVISTLNYLENTDLSDIKYLYYFLHRINFSKYIKGSVIPHIYFRDYKKEKIPLPPLATQKQIAKKLDYLFDKIERGIKYLKLAKENIIEYKQSMLKYAFEGKLTDCNNWEIKTLGEVCEILDNIRKPINATERKQRLKKSNLRYAYYGATGQIGYIDNFLFDFEAILLGEDGAPFLEPFKNKAYIVSGKYWVNNHAHILRAKDNISINKFLCYFLNTVDYMPYVSGTTRLKLNQFSMKQIKIPIPPIETQKEIVSILDKSFESADNMLKYVEDSLDKAELLKRALLRDAFNAKL